MECQAVILSTGKNLNFDGGGMERDSARESWLTIREAVERMPVPVSRSTLRRWIEEGKHGIVAGRFGSRLVVRADTLPGVVDDLD